MMKTHKPRNNMAGVGFGRVDVKGARAYPIQRTPDTGDILDGCKGLKIM